MAICWLVGFCRLSFFGLAGHLAIKLIWFKKFMQFIMVRLVQNIFDYLRLNWFTYLSVGFDLVEIKKLSRLHTHKILSCVVLKDNGFKSSIMDINSQVNRF